MSTAGERIKQARSLLGWSQSALAEKMAEGGHFWTQNRASKTENGMRPLLFSEAVTLCTLLGVEPNWLAGVDDEPPKWLERYWAGHADGIDAAYRAISDIKRQAEERA